ncbi:PPR1 [Candida margitis]|uniref:PPR1 n=1 Tax=Candida margitis TaxID=1775924 RepID=UPI00222793C4|nr:PPR1 [Candida margitis]KAI5970349.1 PPR1 [Candida margitis]
MSPPSTKKQKTTTTVLPITSLNSDTPTTATATATATSPAVKISRAISACKRCRTKKIKCDQKFPQCGKCAQHNVECIGLDPVTGREIPRSYIVHLEERVKLLEKKLDDFGVDLNADTNGDGDGEYKEDEAPANVDIRQEDKELDTFDGGRARERVEKREKGIGGGSNRSGTNKITFSKLMSTAVKVQKRHEKSSDEHYMATVGPTPPTQVTAPGEGRSIDDTMSNDEIKLAAVLPPKNTALQFCQIFFHQCNAQFPIMHREEFIRDYFIPIYGPVEPKAFQFASNDGSINDSFWKSSNDNGIDNTYWFDEYKSQFQHLLAKESEKNNTNNIDIRAISNRITPPRQFHIPLFFLNMIFAIASSVHHLKYPSQISESFRLAAMKYYNDVKRNADQLMALQGILLYTYYSIMRPTNPGVWYIMGEALRVCVDLDLQNELKTKSRQNLNIDGYTRDKRRRIFWCTYSIDRQICFYLDRPFGIPDESINTPLPSIWDDSKMVPRDSIMDYTKLSNDESSIGDVISYKTVSLAMITIRKLQSEVTKILYTGSEIPRQYTDLSHWKMDILSRLTHWYQNLPTPQQMNCDFNPIFFHLNYHHTLLYIHGLGPRNYSLTVDDIRQVSISAKEVINCYTQLFLTKSVNYTWAAVHNLFMAGTSYLYSLYNSDEIRAMNPINTVMLSCSNCLKILSSLIDKCDAAQYCCEIFHNLTLVIAKLKYPNESVNHFLPGNNHKKQGENGNSNEDNGVAAAAITTTPGSVDSGGIDKGETKVSRESLYRINNGNVHSNLFHLVNELDHLNPLTKVSPSSVGARDSAPNPLYGGRRQQPYTEQQQKSHPRQQQQQQQESQSLYGPSLQYEYEQDGNAQPIGATTTSNVDASPYFTPRFDYPEWNDEELDFFFQELNQNHNVVGGIGGEGGSGRGPGTATSTFSEKSTPPPNSQNVQHPTYSGTGAAPVPNTANSREGKRTFELMHNAPTERIWEEFFTSK